MMSPEEISRRLAAFLSREARSEVEVANLRPLAGGASRAAIALDLEVKSGPQAGRYAGVLRLDLGGKIYEASLSRAQEFRLLREAGRAGVNVPRVFWGCEDPSVLGRDFLILERIEGETIGRKIIDAKELEEARRLLPRQMGVQLARIHAMDFAALEFLPRPQPEEPAARAVLRRAREEIDRLDDLHPALEIGWKWLWEQAPPCPRPVLVHGDFRLGNLMVGPEGLRSVLDWEFSSVGDPHEDLAWPFVLDWRFGNEAMRFAGISDGAGFLEAYQKASGREVDGRSLRYWEILGNFRWALGCLTQANRHLSGKERSVELASLGRRAAEMELEMMDLIAGSESQGS